MNNLIHDHSVNQATANKHRIESPIILIGLADGVMHAQGRSKTLPGYELLLLATIGLHGRPIPVESLEEAVWPDADPTRTRRNLRVYVHRIRGRMGRRDGLVSSGERWSFGPHVTLDLWEWERLCDAEAPASIELRRGLLTRAFDAIVTGPAPSLTRSHLGSRLDALFAERLVSVGGLLIDDAFAQNDLDRATGLARAAIAVDPYGEKWHEALIRTHLLRGDAGAARAVLRAYRTKLAIELDERVPEAIEKLFSERL